MEADPPVMTGVVSPRLPARRAAVPRQHGAWAMLATPMLLGVAASTPAAWQLVVAIAAMAGFLVSSTAQAWLRARRDRAYHARLVAFAGLFACAALALVLAWPALLVTLVVLLPATAITLGGARPGTPRDLANSLAQVAQAVVLVPAMAWVSSGWDGDAVSVMTVVAAAFLVGEVLVVRSVIRERGNRRFVALSIGFHAALVLAALALLPGAYALLALILLVRAVLVPAFQVRWAGTAHPLRPVHVGMLELACSIALVVVAFTVPV
jgi:hypothetical protein